MLKQIQDSSIVGSILERGFNSSMIEVNGTAPSLRVRRQRCSDPADSSDSPGLVRISLDHARVG